MSRRPLHAALSLALTWAGWSACSDTTPAQAQNPTPARGQAAQTLTVAEPGRPAEKCVLLQMWRLEDGSSAMKVKSLSTGEIMTVVEPADSTATKDRFRVYRWGKSVVPPPGSPMPPAGVEAAGDASAKRWPSAHETMTKARKGSSTRAVTRAPTPAAEDAAPRTASPAPPRPAVPPVTRAPEKAAASQRAKSTTPAMEVSTPVAPPPIAAMDRNPAVPASEPVLPPVAPPLAVRAPTTEPAPKTTTETQAGEEPVTVAKSAAPAAPESASSLASEPVSRSKPAVSVLPPGPPTPIVQTSAAVSGPAKPSASPNRQADGNVAMDNGHVVSRTAPALPASTVQVVPRRSGPDPLANPDQYVRLNKRDRDEGKPAPAAPRQTAKPAPETNVAVKDARPAKTASATVQPPVTPEQPPAAPPAVAKSAEKAPAETKELATVESDPKVAPPTGPVRVDVPGKPGENTTTAEHRSKPAPATVITPPERTVVQASAPDRPEPIDEPVPVEPPTPAAEPATGTMITVGPARSPEKSSGNTQTVRAPLPPPAAVAPKEPAPTARAKPREEVKQVAVATTPRRPQERLTPAAPRLTAKDDADEGEVRQASLSAPAMALAIKPLPLTDMSTLGGMVEMMKVLSDSGVPAHRQEAAQRLASVDPKAHPYVVEALTSTAKKDKAGQVRLAAIQSLQRMRADSRTVKAALQEAAADRDPRVRDAADEALRAFPPPTTPPIQPVTGFSR